MGFGFIFTLPTNSNRHTFTLKKQGTIVNFGCSLLACAETKVSKSMNSTKSPTSLKRTARTSLPNGGRVLGISDELRLASVDFVGKRLIARFVNGSTVSVNVSRYPRLAHATAVQRSKWRLIGKGSGIHWEAIDEDLSVENLLFASAKTPA
jgi:Protein of unknown function (DUF2442)